MSLDPLIPLPVRTNNSDPWSPWLWPAEGTGSWAGEQKECCGLWDSRGPDKEDNWRPVGKGKYSLRKRRRDFSHSFVTMWANLFHFFFKYHKFYSRRDSSIFFFNIPHRAQQTVSEHWLIDMWILFSFSIVLIWGFHSFIYSTNIYWAHTLCQVWF